MVSFERGVNVLPILARRLRDLVTKGDYVTKPETTGSLPSKPMVSSQPRTYDKRLFQTNQLRTPTSFTPKSLYQNTSFTVDQPTFQPTSPAPKADIGLGSEYKSISQVLQHIGVSTPNASTSIFNSPSKRKVSSYTSTVESQEAMDTSFQAESSFFSTSNPFR
jgi:hypothetical protein